MWLLLKRIKGKMLNRIVSLITKKDIFTYLDLDEYRVIDETSKHIFYQVDGHDLKLRKLPSSDYYVFKQVFIDQEYQSPISYFEKNNIELNTVIDAGANIGLTSIYIKQHFPNAKIVCIEPDNENLALLRYNLQTFIEDKSIKIYHAGLLGVSGLGLSISEGFRGGNDWAKQVEVTESINNLKSITVNDIMDQNNFNNIDLLKIDIEGAETFLLEKNTDLDFLKVTKVIAIEIHDEYNCRGEINQLFQEYNFMLLETGETTLAINKTYFDG